MIRITLISCQVALYNANQTIGILNHSRPTWKSLPSEILGMILSFALPPALIIDAVHWNALNSPARECIGLLRSVVCVCKEWRAHGLTLLYENITLYKGTQIELLLASLRSSKDHTSYLVKSISLQTPPSNLLEEQALGALLNCCPRLSSLSTGRQSWCWTVPSNEDSFGIAIFKKAPNLTSLEIGRGLASLIIYMPILHECAQNLVSLTVYIPSSSRGLDLDIVFPNLRLLSLAYLDEQANRFVLSLMAEKWNFPVLKELIVELCLQPSSEADTYEIGPLKDLLSKVGHTLTYLEFRKGPLEDTKAQCNIQTLLDLCPVLERLVTVLEMLPESHPNIVWVDMWAPLYGNVDGILTQLDAILAQPQFPRFKRARVIYGPQALSNRLPLQLNPLVDEGIIQESLSKFLILASRVLRIVSAPSPPSSDFLFPPEFDSDEDSEEAGDVDESEDNEQGEEDEEADM
jgi:hypothetical protein